MPSAADPTLARAELLDKLRERLVAADALAGEAREGLKRGEASAIDAATARIETLALEFKLLADELRRLPDSTPQAGSHETLRRSREALEQAAVRVARSSAIGSGLLERLVAMSRQLIDAVSVGADGTYTAEGRTTQRALDGRRLRETV